MKLKGRRQSSNVEDSDSFIYKLKNASGGEARRQLKEFKIRQAIKNGELGDYGGDPAVGKRMGLDPKNIDKLAKKLKSADFTDTEKAYHDLRTKPKWKIDRDKKEQERFDQISKDVKRKRNKDKGDKDLPFFKHTVKENK